MRTPFSVRNSLCLLWNRLLHRPERGVPQTIALAFGWLLLMRGMLFLHSGVWAHSLGMFLSDAVGALILTLLLTGLQAKGPRLSFLLLLGCAFYAAGIHLATHETLFRMRHFAKAADPIFLVSSVLTPRLFLLPVYWALCGLLHLLHRLIVPIPPKRSLSLWGVTLLALIIHVLAAPSLTIPANNLLASLFSQLPALLLSLENGEMDSKHPEEFDKNLNATFFLRERAGPQPIDTPNVLLIMIEGLSAGYFPSISRHHELNPILQLHELENDLNARGFRIYRNVLSMQRQTDRGSYPLLCGEYPAFGNVTPKMTAVARSQTPPLSLPQLLARNRYRAVYWQAAPLEYMHKDLFMPKIGFDLAEGMHAFSDQSDPKGWGLPDRSFFPIVAERIREVDRATNPWFVTLLNVGTHHPFHNQKDPPPAPPNSPPLSPESRHEDRRAAWREMETALISFLEELDQEGILDHTFVIITSDEAGGFLRREQAWTPLDGNFGMIALRPPKNFPLNNFAEPDQLVAHLDIPLTILDMAGVEESGDMIGRSLLVRKSAIERGLLLGDVYTGQTYFLLESGTLISCPETLFPCDTWQFDPRRLFGSLHPSEHEPFLGFHERRSLVERASRIHHQDYE